MSRSSWAPPPLQIDRTGLPGEGFGEGEESHTPMIPKGSADLIASLIPLAHVVSLMPSVETRVLGLP